MSTPENTKSKDQFSNMYVLDVLRGDSIFQLLTTVDNLEDLEKLFRNIDKSNWLTRFPEESNQNSEKKRVKRNRKWGADLKPTFKRKTSAIECFNCKKRGHFMKQCPQPLQDNYWFFTLIKIILLFDKNFYIIVNILNILDKISYHYKPRLITYCL